MGRTLPSFTQLILGEQGALAKFRRALRREDQRALDDLFRAARYHVAAAAYASHLLPFETMLLAMLIEEHKRVERLTILLEGLLEKMRDPKGTPEWGMQNQGTEQAALGSALSPIGELLSAINKTAPVPVLGDRAQVGRPEGGAPSLVLLDACSVENLAERLRIIRLWVNTRTRHSCF